MLKILIILYLSVQTLTCYAGELRLNKNTCSKLFYSDSNIKSANIKVSSLDPTTAHSIIDAVNKLQFHQNHLNKILQDYRDQLIRILQDDPKLFSIIKSSSEISRINLSFWDEIKSRQQKIERIQKISDEVSDIFKSWIEYYNNSERYSPLHKQFMASLYEQISRGIFRRKPKQRELSDPAKYWISFGDLLTRSQSSNLSTSEWHDLLSPPENAAILETVRPEEWADEMRDPKFSNFIYSLQTHELHAIHVQWSALRNTVYFFQMFKSVPHDPSTSEFYIRNYNLSARQNTIQKGLHILKIEFGPHFSLERLKTVTIQRQFGFDQIFREGFFY